jgi:AcrR family transcriptional regulator
MAVSKPTRSAESDPSGGPEGSQGRHPRQKRERALVKATRELFDSRGGQDAPIEEIAKSVGIARGLIYRHFSSKEELYVLTVTDYLDELDDLLAAAVDADDDPAAELERCAEAFAGFCGRYPAFLDSALALMRRPARELNDSVSESVWLRLGQGMARCLDHLAAVLRRGNDTGEFAVEDPDYCANLLWTQMLGAMHLVRIGVGVRQASPDVPELFRVSAEQVIETCVASASALARAPRDPSA